MTDEIAPSWRLRIDRTLDPMIQRWIEEVMAPHRFRYDPESMQFAADGMDRIELDSMISMVIDLCRSSLGGIIEDGDLEDYMDTLASEGTLKRGTEPLPEDAFDTACIAAIVYVKILRILGSEASVEIAVEDGIPYIGLVAE
jgi:hypothetical protein